MKIPKKTSIAVVAALILLVFIGLAAYKMVYDLTTFPAHKDLVGVIKQLEKLDATEVCIHRDGVGSGTGYVMLSEETLYFTVRQPAKAFDAALRTSLARTGFTVADDKTPLNTANGAQKPQSQLIITDNAKKTTAKLKLYENIGVNSDCTLVKDTASVGPAAARASAGKVETAVYLYGQHTQ